MTVLERAAPPGTVASASLQERLRARRGTIVVVALLLLGALLLAAAASRRTVGLLDPDATDPQGAHALAVLLADQGVGVVRVTTATEAADALRASPGATLLVAPTAPLSERMVGEVHGVAAAYVVLLGPDDATLAAFAPWARPESVRTSSDEVPAACTWGVAVRAGARPQAGATYTTTRADASSCWGGGVLDAAAPTGTVTVVGMTEAFTNQHLGESGNAAMALGALGRARTLVWWLPSTTDPLQFEAGHEVGIGDLVPPWVAWAVAQVAVAVLVAVWWRGRRLGRVVLEPLPVVVRATEAVEGRARLYRRGHARGRAADALREAAAGRLRARLSLPRGSAVDVVAAAVAARTGRPAAEVSVLLTPGSAPSDDAGLTGLATALDALENEVRRS